MATLLQKSKVMKVAGLSLVVFLAACSSDPRYQRQVSGDESYLDTPPLKTLTIPAGMILPLQNGEYTIQQMDLAGAVGKELDIRPPLQVLALLAGSRVENSAQSSKLLLENTSEYSNLWSQINMLLEKKHHKISQKDDAAKTLTTDWISWLRADENVPYQGRFHISVIPQGYQTVLSVSNEGLKHDGKEIKNPSEIQRYNVLMLNELVNGLSQQQEAATQSSTKDSGVLPVQSGSDNTGLPQIIVRAPYNVVWNRLPYALESVGMQVTDRTRSTGAISVSYKSLSSSGWKALGVEEPSVSEGNYKLQVGDLDNRSSLQFISEKGTPLTQSENDQMVAVLEAAFSKSTDK
ncbi:outer membrane protein assembly factor BamC [Xenorhabdus szentirmaii]|uniref:outer membrane protein assembly factor BamC n=1 Tax=Xenorhabdus szentirmaii TaxID=290112 RepID=UPI0019B543E1|nr:MULTISPECIES: outer membrane protein assembly factor BamC [unclassified Xenorhabdus]MBD2791695.1 outer membrane protein assembly factor BamC [Xenorhabdus sp. CUL]MBD2824627.1 outer membrane protein assembly factor BamC [Xenorhabdus sp. 5]